MTHGRRQSRFQVEADMLRPIAGAAQSLARNSIVMFEVAGSAGVPDVILLVLDQTVVNDRQNKTSLTDLTDVRLMVGMSEFRNSTSREWSLNELSDMSGVGAAHLRRAILPRLRAGGHVVDSGRSWKLAYRYRSMAKKIVTVEAKLRDWRGAVAQASRHASIADAAWVALDRRSVAPALGHSNWFTTYGIGLLSVSTDGAVQKLIPAGTKRPRKPAREHLVERAVALHREGKHSGEIPTVFGVELLASKGVDPRLADAVAH